jgi:hypothetical protein
MTDASKLAGTPEQWVAGNAWAKGLKVGDTFRGSHGEADHRGLTGAARRAFANGALEVLRSTRVWTGRHDLLIERIEFKAT